MRRHTIPSKGFLFLAGVSTLVLAVCAGYYLGVLRGSAPTRLARDSEIPLEYLASPGSFSEVDAARAAVEALATRYIERAREQLASAILQETHTPEAEETKRGRITAAIALMEEARLEFWGTGQEPHIVFTLLYGLKQAGAHGRWVEVYLDLAYRQPADPWVAALAETARAMGQAAGRLEDVETALQYIDQLPLEFQTATRIHTPMTARAADGKAKEGPRAAVL